MHGRNQRTLLLLLRGAPCFLPTPPPSHFRRPSTEEEEEDDETLLGHRRSVGALRVPFDRLYAALARSLHAEQVGALMHAKAERNRHRMGGGIVLWR